MIDTVPAIARVLGFLREQPGLAFCFDCLHGTLAIPVAELRGNVAPAITRTISAVAIDRGRCTVCRREDTVARHG